LKQKDAEAAAEKVFDQKRKAVVDVRGGENRGLERDMPAPLKAGGILIALNRNS
jgi:hypothetical protein